MSIRFCTVRFCDPDCMGTGQNLGTLLFTLKDHIVIQAVFFLKANLHRMNRELQEKLHESATTNQRPIFANQRPHVGISDHGSATTCENQRPRIKDRMLGIQFLQVALIYNQQFMEGSLETKPQRRSEKILCFSNVLWLPGVEKSARYRGGRGVS